MISGGVKHHETTLAQMKPKIPKLVSKRELKKNVGLIHSSAGLGLVERKLFNWLLYQAYDDLPKESFTHELPLSVLKAVMGWESSNNNAGLEDALNGLVVTNVQFNLLNEDLKAEHWETTTLISYGAIAGGRVFWRYDKAMAAKLHRPEVFAMLNLAASQGLESSFAYALYEQVARYAKINITKSFPVPLLRELIGATAHIYNDFRYFNQRVISRAVKEINLVTDLMIEPRFERRGRAVVAVQFKVSPNPQANLLAGAQADVGGTPSPEKQGLQKRLISLGCTERLSRNAIQTSAQPVIQWAVEYAESKLARGEIHTDPSAYVIALIKNPHDTSKVANIVKQGGAAANKAQLEETKAILLKRQTDAALTAADRERRTTEIELLSLDQKKTAAWAFLESTPAAKEFWDDELCRFSGRYQPRFDLFLRGWTPVSDTPDTAAKP